MMRISMPLAGMDTTLKGNADAREKFEDRAFRMLSEGELFYVDTDIHEDAFNSNRHDHGHLGGVSLEVITQSMATRKPGQVLKSESIAETEATSRSSSQDSSGESYIDSLRACPHGTCDPFAPRISLTEACEWDYSKLDSFDLDCRARERSFSEPQLTRHQNRGRAGPQIQRMEWFSQQQQQGRMSVVAEDTASGPRPSGLRSPSLQQQHTSGGDMCAGTADSLQRAWSCLFGGGDHSRVEGISQHLSSCTSTKTFEVSSSERDRDALARLGVVPDANHGIGDVDSMTFTMHIAGHRVVSTILGQHAEYEVRLKGGGRRWSRWQRFSKFKMIASCVKNDPSSVKAWQRVLLAQPHYRCLHPGYLAKKCNLLELFLQQVMFAMPTPALLIHFVSQK